MARYVMDRTFRKIWQRAFHFPCNNTRRTMSHARVASDHISGLPNCTLIEKIIGVNSFCITC